MAAGAKRESSIESVFVINDGSQDDTDAYSYSGGLCRANQGLLEFVEMFKAPIKVLHPLLTATQEGNYVGTEALGPIPFNGVILAHSNESEWRQFRIGSPAGRKRKQGGHAVWQFQTRRQG